MGKNKQKAKKQIAIFETDSLKCVTSSQYGRHLVAKHVIKKGELIIQEPWIVAGPTFSSLLPTCIGCHASRKYFTEKCASCNWYICKEECSKSSPFHSIQECQFLTENKISPLHKTFNYGVIGVLRCLMLKIQNPAKWQELLLLQSHNQERKKLEVWKENKNIVEIIRKTWNLQDLFTADEIFEVCGILEVNSFEMGDAWTFGGIFLKSSMISHDCVPNASQNENIEKRLLEVHAIRDVEEGMPITFCYEASMEGTQWRQRRLQKSKYFQCTCIRCTDPTELGTNFSTLTCQLCKKGDIIRSSDGDCHWKCSKCNSLKTDEDVDSICIEYEALSKSMSTNIETRENFLKKCSSVFHSNHFIPFKMKFDLCLAYGHEENYTLEQLTSAHVARKLELCTSVLKVLHIISPGMSVARGNTLYEHQAAQVLIAKQCIESEKCSRRLIKLKLSVALSNLEEAINIFEIHYALRLLAKHAKDVTLVELKTWIRST